MENQSAKHLWSDYNPLVLKVKWTSLKKTTERIVLLVLILEYPLL